MLQHQERDGEEERKPGGKTRVTDMQSVELNMEDVMHKTKWKIEIRNYSGDPR